MNTIDLQIQSTVSDGKHTPRELVAMSQDEQLSVIALTDHDAVEGISEALAAGEEYHVRVIPGIEMSAEEHGIHILGYGIDHTNQKLLAGLENFRHARVEGLRQMMEKLKTNEGFAVDWEDVLQDTPGSSTITRLHLVRAIMKRPENKEKLNGISQHDFFEQYFSEDGPNYVKRNYMAARDAVALLRRTGGIAVWSHPALHFRGNYDGLEAFLRDLIAWGISGIEVFNPSHTEDDMELLQTLAARYKLIRTAGSDFHEKGNHPRDPRTGLHSADRVGDYETYGFSTEDIIENLDRALSRS